MHVRTGIQQPLRKPPNHCKVITQAVEDHCTPVHQYWSAIVGTGQPSQVIQQAQSLAQPTIRMQLSGKEACTRQWQEWRLRSVQPPAPKRNSSHCPVYL